MVGSGLARSAAVARRGEGETENPRTITETVYLLYERKLFEEVKRGPCPKHIAIIMDGNRRFARDHGGTPTDGHKKGRDKLEEVMEWGRELNIRHLTVFAFSTENANRSPEEVKALFDLFETNFREVADDERVHRHRIRVRAIGEIDTLPENLQAAIRYAEERTKGYSDYFYNIAIAYGARREIVNAIQQIARDAVEGRIRPEEVDESLVSSYLYTSDQPDPDLVLRTSGEVRISNFLLWQLAYSELYFTDVYWPGFRKIDFLRAIRSYQRRQRRFGT